MMGNIRNKRRYSGWFCAFGLLRAVVLLRLSSSSSVAMATLKLYDVLEECNEDANDT